MKKNPVKLTFEMDDVEEQNAAGYHPWGATMVQRPWGSWDGIDPEGNVFGIVDHERLRLGE